MKMMAVCLSDAGSGIKRRTQTIHAPYSGDAERDGDSNVILAPSKGLLDMSSNRTASTANSRTFNAPTSRTVLARTEAASRRL